MKLIDQLRATERAATPGPWTGEGEISLSNSLDGMRTYELLCSENPSHDVAYVNACDHYPPSNNDRALIAAMRNALVCLLDVVEAVEKAYVPYMVDCDCRTCVERRVLHDALEKLRAMGGE